MTTRTLTPVPLSAAAFAPFGDVIEARGAARAINEGHAERYHDLAALDLIADNGRAIISIFRSTPPVYPLILRSMENHPLSSQAFMPLSGRSFLVVVAPAGPFDAAKLAAFVAAPHQGVNIHKGVWHHFNLAVGETSDFLVIDRDGSGANLEEITLSETILLAAPAQKS